MSLFSSNKQQTNYNDNSANAGEGAVAIGAGANVSIATSDPATVAAALASNSSALATAGAVVGRSLSTVDSTEKESTTRYLASLNAITSAAEVSNRSQSDVLDAAQNAINSNNALAAQLAAQVTDSKKDPNNATLETVAKYGVTAAAILGGVALLYFLTRSAK